MPKSSPSLATYTTMMRVNSKGRPYAKDLNDLFSAFLIQQPLTDHRSLFRNYHSTYTTDDAVKSLGQLQFTQLVSTPNPLDPGNPILTRTTTTFSMSRDMAKTLCQHFVNARLAENATDPQNRTIKDRGIWSPTPKGKYMIQNFSQRAQVSISHMQTPLNRIPNFQIVIFERLLDDDQISFSRPNLTQAFQVMMEWLPTQNIMIDDIGGVDSLAGIESYRDSFFGYQCFEWIMEYTSVVSNDEAESVAAEFVLYDWIQQVLDKSDKDLNKKDLYSVFKTGRKTQYYLTDKGRHVLNADTVTLQYYNHAHLNGGTSMTHSGSRTQSSTSSRDGSISRRISPTTKSSYRKEEHTSRLLPSTEESELPNDENGSLIVPQAVITKRKTISTVYDSAVIVDGQTADAINALSTAESVLQIGNNSSCDFGFSSASSTTSSITTTIYPESSLICSKSNRKVVINDSKDSIVQDQLEKLKIASSHQLSDTSNSQNSRLQSVLKDPLMRMHFRQFLKSNFCEENINFWVDYTTLLKKMNRSLDEYRDNNDSLETEDDFERQKNIQSLPVELTESFLAHCCVIYNTYFCPQNAPSELNIDHGLRFDITQYMQATFLPSTPIKSARQQKESTPALGVDAPFGSISVSLCGILTSSVARNGNFANASSVMKQGIEDSPSTCLNKILHLYDLANDHVCKTMAEDSVPRFIKTKEYQNAIKSDCRSDNSQFSEDDLT